MKLLGTAADKMLIVELSQQEWELFSGRRSRHPGTIADIPEVLKLAARNQEQLREASRVIRRLLKLTEGELL